MNKYIAGGILASLLLLGAGEAIAQKPERVEKIPAARERTEKAKEKIVEIKEEAKEKIGEIKEEAKGKIEEARTKVEEIRAERTKKREEIKATTEAKREEMKVAIEAKKTELQERLKAFKDEKKKEIVARVADKFGEINTRLTARFDKTIEKIDALAKRMENRASVLEAEGADVAEVKSAITEIFSSIEVARSTVATQAGKVYSVTDVIQEEATAGKNISGLRETLRNDLKSVQDAIMASKEKVRLAAEAMKKVVVPVSEEQGSGE